MGHGKFDTCTRGWLCYAESTPHQVCERVRALPSSRGGGQNESNRTSATGPPQPSDAPAFPIPRRSFDQDRTFSGGPECFAGRVLLPVVTPLSLPHPPFAHPAHSH